MLLQDWWYTTLLGAETHLTAPLIGQHRAEVAVVGGGAAGLAAAMRLVDLGHDVVLVERNICGGSSTGKSAGFLTPDSELELSQLVRRFGVEGARDLWGCATRGIDLMTAWIRENRIECDLVEQDSLFLANGASGRRDVAAEGAARAKLGLPQTEYDHAALRGVLGSDAYAGGVRYPGTFGVNAMLYAQGMKRVLIEKGARVFEATEVRALDGHTLHTHLGELTADQIIFCIDKVSPRLSPYAANIYHAQTFLSVSEPLDLANVARLFPAGPVQCWDSDLVYTYFRLTGTNRLLLGGGSALTTFSRFDVTTARVIERVQRGFRRKFPFLRDLHFLQYWPGRIDTTRDLMPTIARDARLPWVHHVLGCVGLPWATFSGDFCARHVHDDTPRDDDRFYRYFSPDRPFLLPLGLEPFLGKQIVFSLNNAWAKYFQVDRARDRP
ncbi:MAG: NAD(P)/FAD-dependent oxidoreductase [Thermoplasmatota archaeon]